MASFWTESERGDGQGGERKNNGGNDEEEEPIARTLPDWRTLSSMITIYLQYPNILIQLQHICVTTINTSMDTEPIRHFIHRLHFSSRNGHIIGHTASEGPIHSI